MTDQTEQNKKLPFTTAHQGALLNLLVSDGAFSRQILPFLKEEYFSASRQYVQIFKTISDVSTTVRELSLDIFKAELQKRMERGSISETDQKSFITILERGACMPPKDREYVKENVVEFVKKQSVAIALADAIEHFEQDDLDQAYDVFQKAFKETVNMSQDPGYNYMTESIYERYSQPPRTGVWPTRFEKMNSYCGGGFAESEAVCLIASSGSGKTSYACNIAVDALNQGKRTVFITLEMTELQIAQRCDAIIMGMNPELIQGNIVYQKQLMGALMKYKSDNLFHIKGWPRGGATMGMIRTYLDSIIQTYGKIDVVIIDWIGAMRMPVTRDRKEHDVLGDIADDMVNLSREYKVCLFTCSQTNRSGADSNSFGYDAISGSFRIVFGFDIVLGLAADRKFKLEGKRQLNIIKNRAGIEASITLGACRAALPDFRFTELSDDDEDESVAASAAD